MYIFKKTWLPEKNKKTKKNLSLKKYLTYLTYLIADLSFYKKIKVLMKYLRKKWQA